MQAIETIKRRALRCLAARGALATLAARDHQRCNKDRLMRVI